MKLRRIEAQAFGAFDDCTLERLGDGLTVVLGPNESGKSTYAALVRQVLYGFPDKRSKDRGYQPKSGGRMGRLVFEDASGQWAIARAEGAKGGAVRVDALAGAERPNLLAEVVGSITEQTYRVVFGFGLDELADIATGSDKEVVARLFAGAFGLQVNPMDARQALDDAAATQLKSRGNAVVNSLIAQTREIKARIRDLENEAREYAGEQARLKDLAERLAPLKAARDQLDAERRAVERDLERSRALAASLAEHAEHAAEIALERDTARREAEHTVVDARLLKIAADVTAVLQEESGAKQHAERARQLESRAAELERRAAAFDVPATVRDSAEARAALEAWRSRKARLESDAETAERTSEAAGARAASYEAAQENAPAPARTGAPAAAWVVLALGVVGGIAGALTSQWVAMGLGVAAAVVGSVMLFARRSAEPPAASVAGDAIRLRADAQASAELVVAARERLEAESEEWARWLEERGLDARGADSAAVASLLDNAHERVGLEDQAASARAEALREREAAQAWRERLASLVKGPLGIAEATPEPHALAIRAREAMDAARDAHDRKVAAAQRADAAHAEVERLAQQRERLEEDLARMVRERGVEGDPVQALDEAAIALSTGFEEAARVCAELATEHDELAGRLGAQGREDALAAARQEFEGLEARAHAAADRYLVDALARQLVDHARERFERDRQPEVVRTAARVFSTMTAGRFTDVRVPLGDESITVVTAAGEVLPTAHLSRGTAEQLYLALRVGLIESFGEQGPHLPVLMDDIVVNYDAERIEGAAAAVAELAASRQCVFFTCHDATARTLAGAVPGATTISLDRCSL